MNALAQNLAPLARTLDQELTALVRGVSLECLVCGEFVLHVGGTRACPECRSMLAEGSVLREGWRPPEFALPSVEQAG
jgi:hypothetical protein